MEDDFATWLIIISTVLITVVLLVVQLALMIWTYLAIMEYISGEWESVTDLVPPRQMTMNHCHPSLSDGSITRRGCEIFLVLGINPCSPIQHVDQNRLLRSGTQNVGIKRPFPTLPKHDLFCDALGHPSSSNIMPCLSMGCVVLTSMLLSAVLIWRTAWWNYYPLLLCFAASLVGGYAISHAMERRFYA